MQNNGISWNLNVVLRQNNFPRGCSKSSKQFVKREVSKVIVAENKSQMKSYAILYYTNNSK